MTEIVIEIVDAATGQPIKGAMVSVLGAKSSTNEDGEARFFVGKDGELNVYVQHLYYFPLYTTILVPPTRHKLSMLRARF